jgi:hypothetical protein
MTMILPDYIYKTVAPFSPQIKGMDRIRSAISFLVNVIQKLYFLNIQTHLFLLQKASKSRLLTKIRMFSVLET